MTPQQQREIRTAVLRALLHPRSSVAELLEGLPDGDLRECLDVVTETLISWLAFLLLARNARFQMVDRANQRKCIL